MSIENIIPKIGKIPELSSYKIDSKAWKNGIIVRSPNWLGDAIMSFPALKQIKKLLPNNKKLFVLTSSGLKDIYLALNIVDEVITLDKAHKNWTKQDIEKVKKSNAGIAMLFNNSPRDVIFFRLAGISSLFGAASGLRGLLMKKTYKFPKRITGDFNKMHHSAKYLAMAYAICADKWDGVFPEIKINMKQVSSEIIDLCENSRVMSLSPGAAYGKAKMWSSMNFQQVAKHWIENGGVVCVLGTNKESDTARNVLDNLQKEFAYDLTGKTTIIELMYILKNSKICVANDSGIMHLSGALDSEGIAIYGSTDPYATSPLSKKWKLLINKQPCAPCFKRNCPLEKHNCMEAISAEDVINILSQLQKS